LIKTTDNLRRKSHEENGGKKSTIFLGEKNEHKKVSGHILDGNKEHRACRAKPRKKRVSEFEEEN